MLKSIALLVIAILIIDNVVLGIFFFQQTGRLAEVGANLTTLQGEVSTLTGEAAALSHNITILQASIAKSEANATALQAAITQSEAKAAALQDAINQARFQGGGILPPPSLIFNPTGPAVFVLTDLRINETLIQPWDVGTVTVNLTNTGGQAGTYQVVLKLNGEVFLTQSVALDGGKSQIVIFGVKPPKEMHAVITIDNLVVEADWQTH